MMRTQIAPKSESVRGGIQIQSVSRALEILNCFMGTDELGISELSAEMGLHKSTVFGLVNTMVGYGILEQVPSTKKYRLGMTLFTLGNLALSRIDIRSEAREQCFPLAQKYPATIHLATQSMGEVIYLDKIDCSQSLINASSVGRKAPMHCTGVGKAQLAYLPESYIDTYLTFPLKKMTDATITTREQLEESLREVRREGVAIERGEIEDGLTCVAAPIFQKDGLPEMAISLSFPYGRIGSVNEEDVKKDLLACTRELSARLGYRG